MTHPPAGESEHRARRTRVVPIDPLNPDLRAVEEAAAVLRTGGLVAFPTETVYGLGANAFDEAAVASIFSAKGRARDDPLIVHIADAADLGRVSPNLSELASRLAEAFWPGSLTIVLPRGRAVAPSVSAGLDTVAVRVPDHAVAQALIGAADVPVAAPSANRFMRTSATTAAHVLDDLDGRIDVLLDGGPTAAGIESTVVAVDGVRVRVLRQGAVTVEALREAVRGEADAEVEVVARGAQSGSPGTMERHYAPAKPLTLVDGTDSRAAEMLVGLVRDAVASGQRPGVLAVSEDVRMFAAVGGIEVADLGPAENGEAIARRLFAAMRELDRSRADVLFARTVSSAGRGAAVNDRLRRAAGRVVSPRSP